MMHVITGGSGSGKSAYAEQQIVALGEGKRIYIATMQPFGEEGAWRIARHRRMRQDKQFETMECYTDLKSVRVPSDGIVLLECVSNLTANEMYDEAGAGMDTVAAVLEGIRELRHQAKHLVVVTNEVFSDGFAYDASTMQYLRWLGEINRTLAREADRVTEVVYGIPVALK